MTLLLNNCTILPMTEAADGSRSFTGSVGIAGNRIALVTREGAAAEAFRAAHPGVREIDCTGRVLMPGLINAHCHAAMTLQRSYADDIALMEWLHDYIWPFEAKQTPAEIALGAELGVVEMLLGGTTSFVDMYWSEAAIADPVQRLGIRALLGACYLDTNMETFERDLCDALDKTRGCERVRIAVAPHSGYTCSPENLVYGKELARKYGLHYTTHIAETHDESRIIRERYGRTPVAHLDALGVLDDRTIGAHCVHVSEEDIAVLRDRGVAVAHNPQSNMKISSGVAPVEAMRRAGVCCTIATDGPCSNNDLDMWEEMRSASFLQKSATQNPCAVPAYEILKMATVNAARAIGYGGELGVVREGAIADLILVDMRKPHLCPVHDLVSNLVYCGKASDVETVIVNGEIVVEERRVRGVDTADLMQRIQAAAEAIRSR